jgi:hypothetical protein
LAAAWISSVTIITNCRTHNACQDRPTGAAAPVALTHRPVRAGAAVAIRLCVLGAMRRVLTRRDDAVTDRQ